MSGFATARQKMVDGQVRTNDVTDTRILDAMLAIPREQFLPESKRALAYLDLDLDVGDGGAAKRYLIKPQVIAKLLQAAEIVSTDNVLVVGDATGYVSALVSHLAVKVTATEGNTGASASKSGRWPRSPCDLVTMAARAGLVAAKTPTSRPPSASCSKSRCGRTSVAPLRTMTS